MAERAGNAGGEFESPQELLTVFLNGDYLRLISTRDLLNMALTDAPQFYEWLTTYDRERVMNLIGQLYFSESADVNALPPSQRLRVYLTFNRTLFSVEVREQEYSCFWKVLHNHAPADEVFGKYAGQNKRRNTGTRREADFAAGCQAIRDYSLRIPRGTMARFDEPQELVMYLLREALNKAKIKSWARTSRPKRITFPGWTVGSAAPSGFMGVMLVLEYSMLAAGDVIVEGQLLNSLNPNIHAMPFIVLSLLLLALFNYRGAHVTLTLNFVITVIAFIV